MNIGLGTHFSERIPASDLVTVYDFGFRWVRIDAQQANGEILRAMIGDAEAAGLTTLTIVYDLDAIDEVPIGRWVEWGNELDFTLSPREYRESLDAAAPLALAQGIPLVAPCISNLDRDSLRWLAEVRGDGWPPGVRAISVHRYGDLGSFEWSHPGYDTRDAEVAAFVALCDGLPWLVTEFGYQTGDQDNAISETLQAAYIAAEWQFWRGHGAQAAFLFQINDGTGAGEGWGIRRIDGTWKPAAQAVPREWSTA